MGAIDLLRDLMAEGVEQVVVAVELPGVPPERWIAPQMTFDTGDKTEFGRGWLAIMVVSSRGVADAVLH